MLIYLLGRGLLRLSLFTLATGYNSGMQKGGQNQMFVFKILAASKGYVQKVYFIIYKDVTLNTLKNKLNLSPLCEFNIILCMLTT